MHARIFLDCFTGNVACVSEAGQTETFQKIIWIFSSSSHQHICSPHDSGSPSPTRGTATAANMQLQGKLRVRKERGRKRKRVLMFTMLDVVRRLSLKEEWMTEALVTRKGIERR
jgi:hypothetical protein